MRRSREDSGPRIRHQRCNHDPSFFFSYRAIPWGFRPNCRSAALARPDLLALTALVGAHPRTRDPHGFETTKEFPLLVRLNKTGKLCEHNSSIEVSLSRMLSSYTSWSQKGGHVTCISGHLSYSPSGNGVHF